MAHTICGDAMKIGLPKAMLYYKYDTLWQAFFEGLGCETVIGRDTGRAIMDNGIACSDGENCLPVKIFLGQVADLVGRCDMVFVPRFERVGRNDEFCVRFWGLPDMARNTFPEAAILSRDLGGRGGQAAGFLRLGAELGHGPVRSLRAYIAAAGRQQQADIERAERQTGELERPGIKILLCAQPYIIHDPYIGKPLVDMITGLGVLPIFSDLCDRAASRALSKEISSDLYWGMNRETLGAVPLLRGRIDGVILVTAFPCGCDSIANELAIRRIKDIPVIQLVLDDQQGEAGLRTRIECFADIIKERRRLHAC